MSSRWARGTVLAGWMTSMLLSAALPALAQTRVAVLDFELNDLTPLPNAPEEIERTASVAPMIRRALERAHGHRVVSVDPADQAQTNAGSGYLFDHPEIAAQLGARSGAEWIAIGLVHKPSFLFAYLKVHLINVATQRLAGDYVIEVKGALRETTERGAAHLAGQIAGTIAAAAASEPEQDEL